MKKVSLVLSLMLVIAMTFSMTVSAGPLGITENYPIAVPSAAPSVDGNIDTAGEGWSSPASFNNNTVGYFWHNNPLTSGASIYFAYDADGLYYAADIQEGLSAVMEDGSMAEGNSFIYSTGTDDIDGGYGYNGDVFGLFIDPLGALLDAGLTSNGDFSAWYLVGLFEGDVAKMYREQVNAGDITDQVKVAGKKTEAGWCFEAFIPWDIIAEDTNAASYGDTDVTKADLVQSGALIRAAAMYHDRFYDEEAGENATWGRFITVLKTLPNGIDGSQGSGTDVKSMGLKLYIDQVPGDVIGTTGANPNEAQGSDTGKGTAAPGGDAANGDGGNNGAAGTAGGNAGANNNAAAGGASTTKSASKGQSTGTSSAQTFDIGIAVALGALATSGIGVYVTKKRK